MRKSRLFKIENQKAIITMNDFLVTYGAGILGEEAPNLSQRIYQAGARNLRGLDDLFHDHGKGRKQKYYDIAEGFVRDLYNADDQRAQQMAERLTHRAMRYLGSHAKAFNHWKQA